MDLLRNILNRAIMIVPYLEEYLTELSLCILMDEACPSILGLLMVTAWSRKMSGTQIVSAFLAGSSTYGKPLESSLALGDESLWKVILGSFQTSLKVVSKEILWFITETEIMFLRLREALTSRGVLGGFSSGL